MEDSSMRKTNINRNFKDTENNLNYLDDTKKRTLHKPNNDYVDEDGPTNIEI